VPVVPLRALRRRGQGRIVGAAVVHWVRVDKFQPGGAALADRHYSRRTKGSPQFMPPGQTLVLMTPRGDAVYGWWRPDPSSGIKQMNGLDGWTCTIFRNEGRVLSSTLILEAEVALAGRYDCGPDGFITYVFDNKIRSTNPGCCFKAAGWRVTGRSADGKKTLLQKPFAEAGIARTARQPRMEVAP
jgi:hypothetical protein